MSREPLNLEDILTDRVVEDDLLEVPVTDRLFRRLLLVGIFVVVGVGIRVGYFSLVEHEAFAARALANMSDSRVELAPRGVIYDRYGVPLVKNVPSFNIILAPRYLPTSPEERRATLTRLGEALGSDQQTLFDTVAKKNWNVADELVLTTNPSQDVLVAVASAKLPGVSVVPSFNRVVANPLAFSHLIGYVGLANDADLHADDRLIVNDVVGRVGLEGSYDSVLRGVNGERVTLRDARGEVRGERAAQDSAAGGDLRTFIDADFQTYLSDRLSQGLAELGRTSGAAIALNPQNGEVLALASVPGYDPGKIASYLSDPTKPLFNRAVSGVYSPGSTIKPLMATAALTDGIVTPDTSIFSSGKLELPNPYVPDQPSIFPDWKPHGWVDVRSALARSSNVYFYEVGGGFESQRGLGIVALKRWWQVFRLDQPTGIDLDEEEKGFLPDPEWFERTFDRPWRIGDTYHVSIGQGDLGVTPIALLNYIAAVANGGIWYQPRIVQSVGGPASPDPLRRSSSPASTRRLGEAGEASERASRGGPIILQDSSSTLGPALEVVRQGMRDGVRQPYGTSYALHDLPIPVAGKTGTAQIENNQRTNAFFVGFAPSDRPELALLILIENSREGSMNTTPVARDVFLWYYEHRMRDRSPQATEPRT
ncbi:MAG: penicillin-binding transpeptidase domain-containing protein [bacterium]|nr:penicillin-binding transpeptidase domain-containing protein [bacterium]